MNSQTKQSSRYRTREAGRFGPQSLLTTLVGTALLAMSAQALADKIYVAASGSGAINVIDSTTNQVTANIPIASPGYIAISPDGKRGYVTAGAGLVTIDLTAHTIIATTPIASGQQVAVALNPSGTRAYVTAGPYVAVIDTVSLGVIAQIPIPVHLATTVAVSPDGSRIYVGNQASLLYVIDAATNSIVTSIAVGDFIGEIAVHPAGTFVYAAVINSNTVAVIDSATNTLVAQVPVGPGCIYCGPSTVSVDPMGDFVYAPAQGNSVLHTIRTSDNAVVGTAPTTGNYPLSSAIHPDGKTLYVTNYLDGTLSVISPQTQTVIATIPVGSQPRGVAVVRTPNQPTYTFSGFYAPVDNPPVVNTVKGGQGVPVKFGLGGNQGLAIFLGAGPVSQPVHCTSGTVLDAVNETVSAGSSGLNYDAGAGQYVYVWKTEKAWAGTCRQLTLPFADGSTRRANFMFDK